MGGRPRKTDLALTREERRSPFPPSGYGLGFSGKQCGPGWKTTAEDGQEEPESLEERLAWMSHVVQPGGFQFVAD